MPLRVFNHFAAGFVFALAAGGDGHIGHGLSAGQITHFGVAAAVAEQYDFVDGCHGVPLDVTVNKWCLVPDYAASTLAVSVTCVL